MNSKKLVFLLLVLGLAAIAGLWLSGAILTTWLGVHSPKPFVYVDYLKHLSEARYQPFANKIKISGGVGFGLPVLAWAFMLIMAIKPKPKAIHGDARFATAGDVAEKKLFEDASNGIVIGKLGSKLMKLAGQQFVILAAPTRSGKGVGVVIPNLLEYGESCVVLDIKQENYELTSGWRQSQGQEIFLFNPFAEDRRTHRWNPLSYVSRDPAFRVSDLQSIAAMLYPDVSDDQKFWVSQARNAFMAFSLYLFNNFDDQCEAGLPDEFQAFPTLGGIYRMSSGDGSPLREYLKTASERTFVKSQTKTAFNNLLSQADETFASILGTFKEPLNPWINPVLDAATSANDFWLTDVRRRKMTIYIAIQPNKLAEAKLIVNLFFSQLINVNTKELPQNNKNLKHQCLLLMDEFTSIGKVDIIANAVSYMAGYNIRLLPIIQSMAQLDATYGKEVSRTIITNHALQIVYAPREQQDANDYSEMLGYTTVRKRNRSTSHGREGSVSYAEVEEKRALMLPQELKAMGNEKEIVFYEGLPHPVLAQKIKYYEDKHFTQRLLPKVEIPMVEIPGLETAKKLATTGIAAAALAGLAGCAQPGHVPPQAAAPAAQMQPRPLSVEDEQPIHGPSTHELYRSDGSGIDAYSGELTAHEVQEKLLKLLDGVVTNKTPDARWMAETLGLEVRKDADSGWTAASGLIKDARWQYSYIYRPAGDIDDKIRIEANFTVISKDDIKDADAAICTLPLEPFLHALRQRGYSLGEEPSKIYGKTLWAGEHPTGTMLDVNFYKKTSPPGINQDCLLDVTVTLPRS